MIALAGEGVGVWAIGLWPGRSIADDLALFGVGILCLVFYSGLLGLWIVKLWNGTWAAFCDSAASNFP